MYVWEPHLWQCHPQSVQSLQQLCQVYCYLAKTHGQIWNQCCHFQWRYRLLNQIQLSPLRRKRNGEQEIQQGNPIKIAWSMTKQALIYTNAYYHHPEWWQWWFVGSNWQHCPLSSETQWKTRYSPPHYHQWWVSSQFGLYCHYWMSGPWTQMCSQTKLEGDNDKT